MTELMILLLLVSIVVVLCSIIWHLYLYRQHQEHEIDISERAIADAIGRHVKLMF